MVKNIIIFILGTLFGSYVMSNHLFKKTAMKIINEYEKTKDDES